MDDENMGKTPREGAEVPPIDAGQGAAQAAHPEAEEGATAVVPPAEEGATAVVPPAEEGATHVLGGEPAGATRVMPAARAGATPPPRPSPTLKMSHAPKPRGGSNAWWIILLVIVVIAAAAAALWYFDLRNKGSQPASSSSQSPLASWAGAWARTDGAGGGLIIQGSSGAYQVTMYDGSLRPLGVASATTAGTELKFTLATQGTINGLTGPFAITVSQGSARDSAEMTVVSASQSSTTIDLARVASLLPATPTASPSLTGSPSPSGSPTTSADQQVINGVAKIQAGIITWATNHGNVYPVLGDVVQGGAVAQYVTPWPTNPYNNQAMKPGTAPGDYTYEQINGGSAYRITGYLSNGLTYVLP